MSRILETIIAKCCDKIFSWFEPRWTAEVEVVRLACSESRDLIFNNQLPIKAYWPALAHNSKTILVNRKEPLVHTQAMAIASEHLRSVKFPLPMRKKASAYAKDSWERVAMIKNYRPISYKLPERSDFIIDWHHITQDRQEMPPGELTLHCPTDHSAGIIGLGRE